MDEIEQALQSLQLQTEDSSDISEAVGVLAEASKRDPSARERLADTTILTKLVEVIETSINDSLEIVDLGLRCIGNASIDNNAARETLTNMGFSWAIRCLQTGAYHDVETRTLAAKVLYNICCDYEAAQRKCYSEQVHYELIALLSTHPVVESDDDKSLIIELLFWICSHKEPDSSTNDPLPEPRFLELVMLPLFYHGKLNPEDSAMLLETCLLYLRDSQTQKDVVTRRQTSRVFRMLAQNEAKITQLAQREEEQKFLIPLSSSLIWCLSDISALPEFGQTYNLETSWIKENVLDAVSHAGDSDSNPRFFTAACQMLGNMLWSMANPDHFAELVLSRRFHSPLFKRITVAQDTEVLHAAAGVLIQLSRPSSAREEMGRSANARTALEKLCKHAMPQLKQDGIKLLRSMGRESRQNQRRFSDLAQEVMQNSYDEDTNMTEAPA